MRPQAQTPHSQGEPFPEMPVELLCDEQDTVPNTLPFRLSPLNIVVYQFVVTTKALFLIR
jgi:hypothetical protein